MNGNTAVLLAALVSLAISGMLGIWMIPFLHKLKYGQTILEIGPKWHKNKQGTPTMGGFMFIAGVLAATAVCILTLTLEGEAPGGYGQVIGARLFAGLLMALGFAVIGFADDYVKVAKKRNLGLTARQKLMIQFAVAGLYLWALYASGDRSTILIVPFFGQINFGVFYWPLSLLGIVYFVNSVNLTDGLDGLAGSVTMMAALGFLAVSMALDNIPMQIFAAALAGGCLGFLIWNFYPAKVFMGDTGSLFLGGMVCGLAFATDMPLVLILVGIIYILETLSDIIQVTYFKLTHGKRIFKMAPLHHHFEMCGWREKKVVAVFAFVSALFCLVAYLGVMERYMV